MRCRKVSHTTCPVLPLSPYLSEVSGWPRGKTLFCPCGIAGQVSAMNSPQANAAAALRFAGSLTSTGMVELTVIVGPCCAIADCREGASATMATTLAATLPASRLFTTTVGTRFMGPTPAWCEADLSAPKTTFGFSRCYR